MNHPVIPPRQGLLILKNLAHRGAVGEEPASRFACEYEIERAIKDEGQALLGWRDVPVDNSDLGESVKLIEPVIRQVFVGRGAGVTVTDALERKLYIIRKSAGHAIQALKRWWRASATTAASI